MANIKLYYFPARLRAEFIRLMYVASGQEFEDNIVQPGEWGTRQAETPYGQLPYMIYDGKIYGQSVAIANFVARELGYYGKTNLDGLRIDEVVQLGEEVKEKLVYEWFYVPDDKRPEAVKKFSDVYFPKLFGFYEKLLKENGDNGFFVGNSLTLADFQAHDMTSTALGWNPEALGDYPNLQKLRSNVESIPAVKAHVASRPKWST